MGPLENIRILDFSALGPGPYASMLLADMGADVMRVARVSAPVDIAGFTRDLVGRGKRSIALDLKNPSGVEAAQRIADTCDVVLEGFRPGVMERLGLGPDKLMESNPRLIYARLTGWGQTGPLALRAGHDINYIAIAGVLSAIGRKGERPVPPVNLVGDFAGGSLFCAFGIVCALLERATSGRGQIVDAAMVDGAANLFSFFAAAVQAGTWGPRGTNLVDTGAPSYDVYETSDGRFMAVGALEPHFYAELLSGLGLDAANIPDQYDPDRVEELRSVLAGIFRSKTRDDWDEVFRDMDACVAPVLDYREAPTHPANAERNVFVEGMDGIIQPAPAPRLSRTPGQVTSAPPKPGAHTRQVLAEAGYSGEAIESLLEMGSAAASD